MTTLVCPRCGIVHPQCPPLTCEPPPYFVSYSKDGSLKKCKFCGSNVWWNLATGRWYDVGGKTFHSDSCEATKSHFSNQKLESAEARRQQRPR